MKAILKNNKSILIPYCVLLIIAVLTIVSNSKAATHLFFNSFHNSFFDTFFYYTTFLGDGFTTVLVVIILLVVNYRYALIVAFSSAIASIFTQFLKRSVFDNAARPKKFFEGLHDLYFVPGVENFSNNSFPSGHSTSAFSLFFVLAFIVQQKRYKLLFFTIALLAGYSRIYLSQHFLEDVTAGSVIGTLTAVFIFNWISKIENKKLDNSLIDSFKKAQ